jgi:hypothetical protein
MPYFGCEKNKCMHEVKTSMITPNVPDVSGRIVHMSCETHDNEFRVRKV